MADNVILEISGVSTATQATVKRLIDELKRHKQVADLGPTNWTISYYGCQDVEEAKQELRAVLDEIDKDWQFRVTIA